MINNYVTYHRLIDLQHEIDSHNIADARLRHLIEAFVDPRTNTVSPQSVTVIVKHATVNHKIFRRPSADRWRPIELQGWLVLLAGLYLLADGTFLDATDATEPHQVRSVGDNALRRHYQAITDFLLTGTPQ